MAAALLDVQWPTARWPVYVFLAGAMACLLTSATCHLLACCSFEAGPVAAQPNLLRGAQRPSDICNWNWCKLRCSGVLLCRSISSYGGWIMQVTHWLSNCICN